MGKKAVIIVIIIIIALFYIGYKSRNLFWGIETKNKHLLIESFEQCEEAGYPVMESYPRQCRIPDGRLFVEEVENVVKEPGDSPIPVLPIKQPKCIVTGCSGQICAEEDTITTCEWLPEYACYRDVICERQPNGSCGWTMTQELIECLGQ